MSPKKDGKGKGGGNPLEGGAEPQPPGQQAEEELPPEGPNPFAPAAAEPAGEARETSCASCRTKSLVARPRKGRLNEPLSSQQRSASLLSWNDFAREH